LKKAKIQPPSPEGGWGLNGYKEWQVSPEHGSVGCLYEQRQPRQNFVIDRLGFTAFTPIYALNHVTRLQNNTNTSKTVLTR